MLLLSLCKSKHTFIPFPLRGIVCGKFSLKLYFVQHFAKQICFTFSVFLSYFSAQMSPQIANNAKRQISKQMEDDTGVKFHIVWNSTTISG